MLEAAFDFGYSAIWTHGHLLPAALGAAIALPAWRRGWSLWILVPAALLCTWSLTAFVALQATFSPNSPLTLPTEHFLASGTGQVLDIGAGSGRATLMVLQARPQARVTSLDRFAAGYGIEGNNPERLLANARLAGVADRVEIQTGDAREMPFPGAKFDAAVSSYVIDHLGREGTRRALSETYRVLRPGGEFLLIVINRDGWVSFIYPFLHGHGYFGQKPARTQWNESMARAGFEIAEDGTIPGSVYVVGRKRRD